MDHPFGNHFVGYVQQQRQPSQEEIDLAIEQLLRSQQQPLAFPPLPPPVTPEYAFYQQYQQQQLRDAIGDEEEEEGNEENDEEYEGDEDEGNEEDGGDNVLDGYAQGYGHGYDDGLFHSPNYPMPIVISDNYDQEDAYDDDDTDPQGCDDWDPGAGGEGGCSV